MPLTSKLLSNARKGISKAPLIVSSSSSASDDRGERDETVSQAGGNVLFVDDPGAFSRSMQSPETHGLPYGAGPGIDLRRLLQNPVATPSFGRSLMVEGGASVISSFLSTPGLVDLVIVTVAPVLVGDDGVSATKEGVSAAPLAAGFAVRLLRSLRRSTFPDSNPFGRKSSGRTPSLPVSQCILNPHRIAKYRNNSIYRCVALSSTMQSR